MNKEQLKAKVISSLQSTVEVIFIPEFNKNLKDLGILKDINLIENELIINLQFTFPIHNEFKQNLTAKIKYEIVNSKYYSEHLINHLANKEIVVNIHFKIFSHSLSQNIKKISNIKNIIAVASGKGGVGKSTICTNLAKALQQSGAVVGVLDADIYGPSLPIILGIKDFDIPTFKDKFFPIEKHGLYTMSLGYLIKNKEPAIWRGPMASRALMQLLEQTEWPQLDYLFIDLPPGTGDIQLTMLQKIPLTGAIVVTTPQMIATQIAGKAIAMFNKLQIPVLGVVENMGQHTCSHCGHSENIFGSNGGMDLANKYEIDLLGSIPLHPHIREKTDSGELVIQKDGISNDTDTDNNKELDALSAKYLEIAMKLAYKSSCLERDYSLSLGIQIVN